MSVSVQWNLAISVLDSGAEGPGFKTLSGNSLRQIVHTHRASVHQAAKQTGSSPVKDCEGKCRADGK